MNSVSSEKAIDNQFVEISVASESGVRVELTRGPQMSYKRKFSTCNDIHDGVGAASASHVPHSEDNGCVVCLETCHPDDQLCTLPCLHSFHSVCIHPWLVDNPTCPICRKPADTCNRGTIDRHSPHVVSVMLRHMCNSNSTLKKDLQEANDHILSLQMVVAEFNRRRSDSILRVMIQNEFTV